MGRKRNKNKRTRKSDSIIKENNKQNIEIADTLITASSPYIFRKYQMLNTYEGRVFPPHILTLDFGDWDLMKHHNKVYLSFEKITTLMGIICKKYNIDKYIGKLIIKNIESQYSDLFFFHMYWNELIYSKSDKLLEMVLRNYNFTHHLNNRFNMYMSTKMCHLMPIKPSNVVDCKRFLRKYNTIRIKI